MTKEQILFIQILNDFINGEKSNIPDDIDLGKFQYYGKLHEVSGIIYYQTRMKCFHSAFLYSVYAYKNRQEIINELTEQFKFPCFCVKGMEIAELYPVPELRTMGDCDLVVHSYDREVAHRIFITQKFENVTKQHDREWQYYKRNMEFELHDRLIYKEVVNNSKQELFFNNCWEYVNANKLDWNFHFLYLVAHLRKHFMNMGCGFRPFIDLAVIINNIKLDWDWIETNAREIELLPFLKSVLAFCEKWFSITVPIHVTELDEDFLMLSTEKIFEDGIFGFDNEDNRQNEMINIYHLQGKKGICINVLKEVFPSYKSLSNVTEYNFVRRKPYLLPVAWFYRVFKNRDNLNQKINRMKQHYSVDTEKIQKREEFYSRWGLIEENNQNKGEK